MARARTILTIAAAWALALAAAACGGSAEDGSRAAPSPAAFPSAQGRTIEQMMRAGGAQPSKLVVLPGGRAFELGANRYAAGVFSLGGAQIEDADMAMYFAKDVGAPVQGPLPAKVVPLEAKPAYRATGSSAPGDPKTVYVVPEVRFDRPGPWLAIAMLKTPDGLRTTRVESPVVGAFPGIVRVGQQAPVIHTPTAEDVGGDLSKIDTRVPPDQMHEVDFADVVGRKPVVITFATPAFCESRLCGPVVDVVQQVADETGDKAEFIHMEVWRDNDPSTERVNPQLRAFGLQTEPWTFLIDADGVVRERLEGAVGVAELRQAVRSMLRSG